MKKLFSVFAISIILPFASCNKFIETKVTDVVFSGTYYNTQEELEASLAGIYASMGAYGLYNLSMIYMLGLEGDEAFNNSVNISSSVVRSNVTKGDKDIAEMWRALYIGVDRANNLIANVDKNPAIAQEIRDRIRGEALFLRGYYYFLLVQYYGGVPVKTTPSVSVENVHIARSSIKEVYTQIISDMKTAEPLVEDISKLGYGGRVSKSAVRGILARVYLYMSGYPLREDHYEDVVYWTKKVIDDPAHDLNPSYSDIFIKIAQDKYDIKECIWEAEFWGNGESEFSKTTRNGMANGPGSTNNVTGRSDGFLTLSAKLFDSYENADLRKFWCIPFFTYDATGPNGAKTLKTTQLTGYTQTAKWSIKPAKYRREYETLTPKLFGQTGQNIPLLRYSDVLLMYAEALNELEGPASAEAINAINRVRIRAYDIGGIKGFTIVTRGLGYTSAPTVVFSGGGQTVAAEATATVGPATGNFPRMLTGITLNRDPSGVTFYKSGKYTSPPALSFVGGGGSGATATATIYTEEDAKVPAAAKESKESLRKFIQDERMRELNFELLRRSDLIRWGILQENFQEVGLDLKVARPGLTLPIASFLNLRAPVHLLFPIPELELMSNRLMTQNPGY